MLLTQRRMVAMVIGLATTFLLAGCAGDDAATYLASAKSYLDKSDPRAAIIELRNAREKAPENAEVRFLLGKALLDNGEPGPAETELRRAETLKYPAEAVQPLLAQALLAQGDYRRLAVEFGTANIADRGARADVAATMAVAQLAQGDREAAGKWVDTALAARPEHARALTVRAQLLALSGDFEGAGRALDTALAASPNDPEAAVMKAELLAARGKRDEAVKLLAATLSAKPAALHVRAALVPMLVTSGDLERAASEVELMTKASPRDFRTVYAEALLAYAKRDFVKARDLALPLVATRANHAPSLFLLGLANYELKSWSVAESSLQKVTQLVPGDPRAYRALTATYLHSGRVVQAAETADSSLRRFPDDSTLLRLAGEAQLLNGNATGALRHFERAAKLESDGSIARVRLAQVRLVRGDADQAIADLEELASADRSATQADLALYAAHFSRRDYDKALAVLDSLAKKQPGALVEELRGNVGLATRDYAGARKNYGRALELEPGRLSAARALARLDLLENRPADARARYEKMIAADPRNDQLRLAMAELQNLSGASVAEVRATLESAVADNPTSAAARLALVNYLRRIGDASAALSAARTAAAALPDNPQVTELLGTIQIANQEFGQARDTFLRLVELQPRNPAALLRLAEAYVAQKDYAAALDIQRKALAMQPGSTAALSAIAATQLLAGKPGDAIIDARRLQKEQPDKPVGFVLEAEILVAQKKFSEAALALQQAIQRTPSGMFAGRLHSVLLAAGRPGEANALVERWSKEHPKDTEFLSLVGQQRQATQDVPGAVAAYRAVLAIDPDDVIALNNLAWMLNATGKPEAVDLAERAYRLAPLNPSVIDTLGTVLVAQGDAKRGISLLRMGANLSPAQPHLRVNLAKALAKTGDKAGAKRELEAVIAGSARPSPAKAEAEALLKTL